MSQKKLERPKRIVCEGCGSQKSVDELKEYINCCPDGRHSEHMYNQGLADQEAYDKARMPGVEEIAKIINEYCIEQFGDSFCEIAQAADCEGYGAELELADAIHRRLTEGK